MPHFLICAVPEPFWRAGPTGPDESLRQVLGESQALWRRIQKGVNLEMERVRYLSCLAHLERLIRSEVRPVDGPAPFAEAIRDGALPGVGVAGEYFDFLAATYQRTDIGEGGTVRPPGLGAAVIPPAALAGHLDATDRALASAADLPKAVIEAVHSRSSALRSWFLPAGCGAVEIQEIFDNRAPSAPVPRPGGPARPPAPPTEGDIDEDDGRASDRREAMAFRFRREVESALAFGSPINLSNQPHDISTEVLGEFVAQGDGRPVAVRVVYADGSEADPFPLRCLPSRPASRDTTVLRAALMSMRHLDMDPHVDFAWYRNREVSQSRTLAESDQFCYESSLRQLRGLREAFTGRHVTLLMHHTGFEPAAIGFYRAVVRTLGEVGGGWLTVRPRYYRGGHYEDSAHAWA